jgi:hypothetical protein
MGAGPPGHQVSKAALNALTRTLVAQFERAQILANVACPGWTATDMGRSGRSVQDGAASVVWAMRLPDTVPNVSFGMESPSPGERSDRQSHRRKSGAYEGRIWIEAIGTDVGRLRMVTRCRDEQQGEPQQYATAPHDRTKPCPPSRLLDHFR